MRTHASWWRSIGILLEDRLDQLQVTLAHVKQRLRHSLTDLISQFVADTVHETVTATLTRAAARGSDPHVVRDDAWWSPANVSDWSEDEDRWEASQRKDASEPPAGPAPNPRLPGAVSAGCELVACLLKGWSETLSVQAALGLGLLLSAAALVMPSWLGDSLSLTTTGLQFLSLVQPTS